MRKRIITCGLLIVSIVLVIALIGCSDKAMSYSWSTTGESHDVQADSWTILAKTVDGHASRNVEMSSDNLKAIHIENTNTVGSVFLVVTQGKTEETYTITGPFSGGIDTSMFSPGKLTLRVNFEKAENVSLVITWYF
ncbi:MAG: hypothetical protein LBU61_01840 [Coriobacteriales bacterium]|jgi:outer membrane lipoprotein SlyB|nr:hypothetical protein [Coriobacteriales bacterium]